MTASTEMRHILSLLPSTSGPRITICTLVWACVSLGQSFFNARGLGELVPPADARILALGSPSALSYRNPGILVHLPKTSFGLSVLASGVFGSQSGQTRLIGTVRPAGLNIAAPLPLGTRIMLGLEERFGQDFDLWSASLPDTGCRYHVTGRGGIHVLRAGLGYSFLKTASVGIEYGRVVGASREEWEINVANGRYLSTDTVELSYTGNTLRLGASLQTGRFALGLLYSLPQRLSAASSRRAHGVVEDSLFTHIIRIPAEIDLGISLEPFPSLTAVIGLEHRPWSGITINDTIMARGRNSIRVSSGLEYHTDKFPLRAAYSYEPWYYTSRSFSTIQEHKIWLGSAVPIKEFGALELSASLGRRSTPELSETTAGLLLTLSYNEAWLRRTRRWGY